ncbi:DMT family transporter [Geodermatophilus sp. DSM 44513]|uniref:DMT family transporter n=1 Tax=Geodermatophilus sp. DSM 44513 TaxID=1528104 RepID=UPI00128376C3|nr:DMT family transporter [Geodermatophilus sp. DSM 44513]WNV77214.1 DMT family transporter [Geodermatophilus sp. DSM 44513]
MRTTGGGPGSRWVLAQYLALALTWGASFLFVELGLAGLSPTQVVLGRLVIGALTLVAVTAVTRQQLPREPLVWAHLAVTALLLCVVPFLLFAWAQQSIPSGLASIYNATTPLMTTLVALAALPEERPTAARVTGLLIGFTGVLVVLAPWRGVGSGALPAQAACLLATACYGAAFVHLRRTIAPRGIPAVPVATVQVGLGAVVLLVLAPLFATSPVALSPAVVLGVLALGGLGTGLAYVWNTNVVSGWGATNAATVTYLTPVVGVGLGALVLDEAVTWNQPLGAAVVVLGIVVNQHRPAVPARTRNGGC